MKLKQLPEWYLLKLKASIEANYKVTETGCWEWQKSRSSFGYGRVSIKYNTHKPDGMHLQTSAHRVYYQLARDYVPDNLVLHHQCENPPCINPDHLEVVTQYENTARGRGITANNIRKTVCDNGHEFTPENTGVHTKTGWRYCRICSRKSTNASLRRRTLKNNALGLNSKGKPFKSETDKKRSTSWERHRQKLR